MSDTDEHGVADRLHVFSAVLIEQTSHRPHELGSHVGRVLVKPDLVVYLQARTDVLLTRIRRRGRDYERSIDAPWLEALAKAYNEFFFHYDETPLLVVNVSDIDLEGNGDDLETLLAIIRKHRKGTQHYVPLGTRTY